MPTPQRPRRHRDFHPRQRVSRDHDRQHRGLHVKKVPVRGGEHAPSDALLTLVYDDTGNVEKVKIFDHGLDFKEAAQASLDSGGVETAVPPTRTYA